MLQKQLMQQHPGEIEIQEAIIDPVTMKPPQTFERQQSLSPVAVVAATAAEPIRAHKIIVFRYEI